MPDAPLAVAAGQPATRLHDLAGNAAAHADVVRRAGARLVAFPELSLTGYAYDAAVVDPDDPALGPLVAACSEVRAVALAGAVVAGGTPGVLRVDGGGAEVVYRKSFLGSEEARHWRPGPGAVAIDVDGWRVGLGVCKDTGVAEHVDATAALGIDLYVAGVLHAPDELAEQDRRGVAIATACDAHVVLASFAGPTGGGYAASAGTSTVFAPDGTVLARAGEAPGEVVSAVLAPVTLRGRTGRG